MQPSKPAAARRARLHLQMRCAITAAAWMCVGLLAGLAASSDVGLPGSASLMVWSHDRHLLAAPQTVSYATADAVDTIKQLVMATSQGQHSGEHVHGVADAIRQYAHAGSSDLVVVMLGSKADVSALRNSALNTLSSLWEHAKSTVSAPFLAFAGLSLAEAVEAELQQASVAFKVVGCSQDVPDMQAQVAAAAADKAAHVLLVCMQAGHVQAEVEVVAAVQAAVQGAGRAAVYMYASYAAQHQQRRSLQSTVSQASPNTTYVGFGKYQECGQLCQTQVRWLEGMLAILFIALASSSGLTCLHFLKTPSRFESSKESSSS